MYHHWHDLGTTFSAAAYLTPDGPRLIHNAVGEVLTQSIVGLDLDGKLLVGRAASLRFLSTFKFSLDRQFQALTISS